MTSWIKETNNNRYRSFVTNWKTYDATQACHLISQLNKEYLNRTIYVRYSINFRGLNDFNNYIFVFLLFFRNKQQQN